MQLVIEKDSGEACEVGADMVTALLDAEPASKAVLATGHSPMDLYARLAERRAAGVLDAGGITAFQLDEYVGVTDDDARSLYGWMDRSVLGPLRIPGTRVVRFAEAAEDAEAECALHGGRIRQAGGFDLAILGLGPNGHLGFNEPPCDARSTTRVVSLTPESIESNARYWGGPDRVPRRALTVGMDALLASRKILLLVFGAHKHSILRRTVEGPVTPAVPGSFLQEAADVTVIADEAAWTGQG